MSLFSFSSKNGQQEENQQANKREQIDISAWNSFESEQREYKEGDNKGLYEHN